MGEGAFHGCSALKEIRFTSKETQLGDDVFYDCKHLTIYCEVEEKPERITLEVRESNAPAIGLYQKLGFVEVGRRKNYYEKPREDAILMDLNLSQTGKQG